MKKLIQTLPLLSAMLLTCGSAMASITVYLSQATFLSAISAPATDTFEDLVPGSVLPGPITRTAGAYRYTVNAAPTQTLFVAGAGPDAWLSTNTATDSIVFVSFSGDVQAVGGFFFGTDFDGGFVPGSILVSASDTEGSVSEILEGARTARFLGFVSTSTLTGLEVSALQPNFDFLWPTINDLTLGAGPDSVVIPIPGALSMMAPALLLAGLLVRRRRS